MTVLITLTVAGTDSGPFDLYSNLDGYTSPFEVDVPKASLLSGFSSPNVPDYTSTIKCVSKGLCTNYILIPLGDIPIYEISGCRSSVSFFAEGTTPFGLGDLVFFTHNNPINTGTYCGTVINLSATGTVDITLTGFQPTPDCGDLACDTDVDLIP